MRSSQNVYVLVSNRYDHLGRRVQKITPEATHTYFYDGWLLVKEVVERSGDTRRCGGVEARHYSCGTFDATIGHCEMQRWWAGV